MHCSMDYEPVCNQFVVYFFSLSAVFRCDEICLDGSKRLVSEERGTFNHAQKMRAAMTSAEHRSY